MVVAQAAEAAPSRPLRVIFMVVASLAHDGAWKQFPSDRRRPQGVEGAGTQVACLA
jgi:hypothetical protein